MISHNQRAASALLGLLCAVAAVSCGDREPDHDAPNVILISLDTVRRDAVGVYNPGVPSRTPEIDRFARSCVRYDQAWAPVPFTLPSHMSLFTGLHSVAHGVAGKDHVLRPEIPTLGEIASKGGYRNIGLVSNVWMKGSFGFDRGFDHYERIRFGLTYAERINARFFEIIDSDHSVDDRPLFIFLHYIDAHSDYHKSGANALPYYAPPEDLAGLGIDALSTEFCDDEGNCGTKFLTTANNTNRPVDQALIDRIAELYYLGVQVLDRSIGDLLRGLAERGLMENSIVIIMSDHGEEFREHGRFVHAQPYTESLAVPLLVRFPGGAHAGAVVEDPVELADLMPSILVSMGLETPPHVPSRDIFSPIREGGDLVPTLILGADKNRKQRFSVRDERYTFIHDLWSGETELYDRSADPGEARNLIAENIETADRLDAELGDLVERFRVLGKSLGVEGRPDRGADLSEEEKDHLRAIGYLE